ncbi:conserved hypothetical protein [Gammaproteobacteria bacterium]
MGYKLTLPLLNKFTKYFNALSKAGIEFEIEVDQKYDYASGNYNSHLSPAIKNIKNFAELAIVWEAGLAAIKTSSVNDFPGFKEVYDKVNAVTVTAELYKKVNPSIKFFADEVFDKIPQLSIKLLTDNPVERRIDEHTYRICCSTGELYHSDVVFCATELNPYYNYIDKGHILVSTSAQDSPESFLFITNMMTLDLNYIIAAFSVYPDSIQGVLQNKVFLPSANARMSLIRVEKAIPPRFQAAYQALKAEIFANFEKNTQNVMMGRLTRKEAAYVDMNNIRIELTKATYEAGHVSIEADNLSEVIFSKLNPNEEWDIFTLINIYTDWVEAQFKSLSLNAEGTGFKEEKVFRFSINGIPIKVNCFTDNTRRAVNDHLINVEELSKVMRRASCYLTDPENPEHDNVKEYNNFIKEVSRTSLKTRDILANGLPVKTMFLEGDQQGYGKDATRKHPKLRFTKKEKGGFHLTVKHLEEDKVKKGEKKVVQTTERRIGKFAEFVKKVEQLNRNSSFHNYGYYNGGEWIKTHEGGWERKDGAMNTCATGLLALLDTYAEGITAEDKTALVGTVNREMTEAEKRSEELLQEAVKVVKAVKGEKNGKAGYVIPGQIRNYFVEEDSLRVYDNDTGGYLCVVNGQGDQGVGKDSLVTRMYALCNDQMITAKVGTLRK